MLDPDGSQGKSDFSHKKNQRNLLKTERTGLVISSHVFFSRCASLHKHYVTQKDKNRTKSGLNGNADPPPPCLREHNKSELLYLLLKTPAAQILFSSAWNEAAQTHISSLRETSLSAPSNSSAASVTRCSLEENLQKKLDHSCAQLGSDWGPVQRGRRQDFYRKNTERSIFTSNIYLIQTEPETLFKGHTLLTRAGSDFGPEPRRWYQNKA